MMTHNDRGFTLVELLVVMALTSIAMTGIFSSFISQLKTFTVQQEVAAMQQGLRGAMILISNELKMAGYDPTGNADAKIETISKYVSDSEQASIRFTKDDNMNGDVADTGEDLTYALFTEGGIQKLSRRNPTADAAVAEYIDRFHLQFLDENNAVTADADKVRNVQITIVAKVAKKDNNYTENFSYQDLQGNTYLIAADGFRRNVLSMQVNCRNIGLN
jgi:type IV pilus assembly protein PilW